MFGWRSLRYPVLPDRSQPDYNAQWTRYWAESDTWWANWEHDFVVAMIVLPALLAAAVVVAVLA